MVSIQSGPGTLCRQTATIRVKCAHNSVARNDSELECMLTLRRILLRLAQSRCGKTTFA